MNAKYGTAEYEQEVAEFRSKLESEYGTVWNTAEVQRDFDIIGFLAPRVQAVHNETGIKGTLTFTHSPRFYYNFTPLSENEWEIWTRATKIEVVSF